MGSIKMSKLGCKIMSGLTACIIGLSPCIGTQVFAAPVFIRSIKQSKEIEDCTKEELLEMMHDLWLDLYKAYHNVRAAYYEVCDAAGDADYYAAGDADYYAAGDADYYAAGDADYYAAWNAAWDDIWDDIWEAIRNGSDNQVYDTAYNAANHSLSDNDFVATWKFGGKVYNLIIQDKTLYDTEYLMNLTKTLKEKTDLLRDQAIFLQHLVSKKKLIESLPGFLERFNVAMNDCKVVDVKDGAQAAVNIALSAAERVPVIMYSCSANNWKPGGAARKMFKNESIGFFENLVRVLEEQIVFLEDSTKSSIPQNVDVPVHHNQTQDSHQIINVELLGALSGLWSEFMNAVVAVENSPYERGIGNAACVAVAEATGDGVMIAAQHAMGDAAYRIKFIQAWGPGGKIYKVIMHRGKQYLEKVARVLEEQTRILQNIVNQNRH